MINARVETATTSRMFKPLWQYDRTIVFADGWFEWQKQGNQKQSYFNHRTDGKPIFIAAIGSTPYERGEAESFLTVRVAATKAGPIFMTGNHCAAREWMQRTAVCWYFFAEEVTQQIGPTYPR